MKQPTRTLKPRKVFVNPLYKDKATVLKTGEDTNGQYALGELEIAPGGGNGPHYHRSYIETFTAVKGILGVVYNKRKLYLKPGESVTVPVNTPHYFFNDTNETVVCHIKLNPGDDGFVKGIAIGYGLASDGRTNKKGVPKKLSHLGLILLLMDTRMVGPLSILTPLLLWLGKRARKNGTEKRLLEKYYYQ